MCVIISFRFSNNMYTKRCFTLFVYLFALETKWNIRRFSTKMFMYNSL